MPIIINNINAASTDIMYSYNIINFPIREIITAIRNMLCGYFYIASYDGYNYQFGINW